MAGSVNKVILIGNLGRDPDIRMTSDGEPVANLSVATSETWTDKNSGEKKERTEWHRVTIFGGAAKVAQDYLRKGSKVYLEGKLQTRKWQDQSGADRYTTEVVLTKWGSNLCLLGDGGGGNRDPGAQDDGYGGATSGAAPDTSPDPATLPADLDDEIPF